MASAALEKPPTQPGRSTSTIAKSTSSTAIKSNYNPAGLSNDEVQKLLQCDERTLKAALVLRRFIKSCLLAKKERKLAHQIIQLQQQQEVMLTNPQHFQDCELMSLVHPSPLFAAQTRADIDSFRLLAETTDALLRSEIKKFSHVATKMIPEAASNEIKQQLQLIEAGRREILQVYAMRVKAIQTPVPAPTTTATTTSTTPSSTTLAAKSSFVHASEGKENYRKENTQSVRFSADADLGSSEKSKIESHEESRRPRRRRSLSWADTSGQPLTLSQFFESDTIVAPGKSASSVSTPLKLPPALYK